MINMDKFVDFIDFLKRESRDDFYIDLVEIERIIGQPLSKSAHTYSAYWSNDGIHRFAGVIGDAGFKVSPDLRNKRIRLIRYGTEIVKQPKQKHTRKERTEEVVLSEEDKALAEKLKNVNKEKEFSIDMVQSVLDQLAKKDHFFVSEVHLQTEFIIEAAKMYPDMRYYPELAPNNMPDDYEKDFGGKAIFFDLIIKCKTQTVLVEFKYLTREYEEEVDGFRIQVKNHSAQDIRRYDCWKDIARIETCAIDNKIDVDYGYFILVTNDSAYWKTPKSLSTIDGAFRMQSGIHRTGIKRWREDASEGTVGDRKHEINIKNNYYFEYKNFYKEFKSLVVAIDNNHS